MSDFDERYKEAEGTSRDIVLGTGDMQLPLSAIRELILALSGTQDASLTQKGVVILSNLLNGNSESKAATEKAINLLSVALTSTINNHVNNKFNPHAVTKAQVGLTNVDDVKQIPMTMKGVASGVASLNAQGKVIHADGTIPGGLQGVFGTFTGTDVDSRFIATPSVPKFVFMWGVDTIGNLYRKFTLMGVGGGALVMNGGTATISTYKPVENTTGSPKRGIEGSGFYVSNYADSGNKTGTTYNYLAVY